MALDIDEQNAYRLWRITQNPEWLATRWIGECGHEWRKDQSEFCPICERDCLKEELRNAYAASSA